jgi:prepilin-type N-terminal cleavage/methylation domain-containing protein
MKQRKEHGMDLPPTQKAFSLVELSIVLVILGLLIGGILSGQSLIRASELRAVVTEYNRYYTATQTFRDKYFALPGDMTNATAFWGKDNTNCAGNTGTNATPGTCNGNGDGLMTVAGGASTTGETYRFWQHLALSGLIEGTYSGQAGPLDAWDMVQGVNIPRSKLNNGSWGVRDYWAATSGDVTLFVTQYGNWMQMGADTNTDNAAAVLKPEEAWNIDTKLDDGKPGQGKVLARHWGSCTNASSETDVTTTYKLDSSSIACVLVFPRVF